MAEGLSGKSLEFLIELRARNDRDWYYAHKQDYELHVLNPLKAVVTALAPTILKIDPQIETAPAIDKTISRVYRDSRFSADKSLYRDNAWITFCRKAKEMPDVPAFYFEFAPSGYRYGVGFYSASTKTMEEYRSLISRDEDGFIKIVKPIEKSGVFKVEGEKYKRSRYAGAHPEIAAWYDYKSIYLAANRDDVSEIFDFEPLTARLSDGFASLAGIYGFWCKAAHI